MTGITRRRPRMRLLTLLGLGLSAAVLAAPAATSSALAAGSYPPRVNCAVSADLAPGAADTTISGTGFTPRRAVDLSVASIRLASATADSAGNFAVTRHVPATSLRRSVVSATDGRCSTHSSVETAVSPHTGTVSPPIVLGQGQKLISAALPAEIFVGVIATVIATGLIMFFLSERSGRRSE